MEALTRSWDVTVRLDPLWTALLLAGAVLLVFGPPLVVHTLWALRFHRARRVTAGFRRLADCLPSGVVLARPDGRIILANCHAREYWPGLADDVPLPPALDRLRHEHETVTSGIVTGPDGRQLVAQVHALPGRRRHEVVILLDDATHRQQEADFASSLVRQISHELKTPLSVIRGHASRFAADGSGDPAEARRAWAVVDDEATRLTGLIDQAILMARFDVPAPLVQPRPLNLRALCEEAVIDLADRVAREGAELDFEAEDGHYAISGDRAALRQMLLNLIDNALKHGGPAVRITLSLRQPDAAGMIRLAVRDTGPGIPPADLPLIFQRGFRGEHARGSRAGSGLGLALVRAIAEWHGGSVSARNEPDGGASIVVLLPRQRIDARQTERMNL